MSHDDFCDHDHGQDDHYDDFDHFDDDLHDREVVYYLVVEVQSFEYAPYEDWFVPG